MRMIIIIIAVMGIVYGCGAVHYDYAASRREDAARLSTSADILQQREVLRTMRGCMCCDRVDR